MDAVDAVNAVDAASWIRTASLAFVVGTSPKSKADFAHMVAASSSYLVVEPFGS